MRTRRITTCAATALVLALTACAQPAVDAVPTSDPSASVEPTTTAQPTAAASPSMTPATPADPHADWQQIATPNGTATFLIPPAWSAEVDGEELEYDGELRWQNVVHVLDESGTVQLGYVDGPFDDVGVAARFGVVAGERVETLDDAERAAAEQDVLDPSYLDHAALASWADSLSPEITAVVSLALSASLDGNAQPVLLVQDSQRSISFSTQREMSSIDEAEAWLAGDEAARLLEIIGTLDLNAVPAPVLP